MKGRICKTSLKIGLPMLISGKVDFRENNMIIDEEKNYLMLKGSIHQEDLTILNVYASSNTASIYMKQYS